MDMMSTWAEQFAEEVIPSEVDLAPAVMTAFMQGGKARQELLKGKKGGVVGGFGVESGLILPFIFHILGNTSILLCSVLTSGLVNNSIGLVKHALELHEVVRKRKSAKGGKEEPAEPLSKLIPASPENKDLLQALNALSDGLKPLGLPQDERDLLALRIFSAFSKNPTKSKEVIEELARKK